MTIMKCKNTACAKISTPAAKDQTKRYGDGVRVHNETKSGLACTICGHTDKATAPSVSKKPEKSEEKAKASA